MIAQVPWLAAGGAGAVSPLMLTASARLGLVAGAIVLSSLLREHVGRRPWRILPRGTIARAGTATRPRNGDGG